MTYYPGEHKTQYDGGPLANQNCGPTSLAMAAHQVTRGRIDQTGSQVRTLIARSEETNPRTPGWSMIDVDRAAARLGIDFWIGLTATWDDAVDLHNEGRGVIFQGDSDQFLNGCSSAYDGDHSIYWPASEDPRKIGDPICWDWAYQDVERIRAYAEKYGRARFGASTPQQISLGYTDLVPREEDMDAARFAPVAVCAVRAGGSLYADPDRQKLIAASWPGGPAIQLYAVPVVPVVNGRAALAMIRVDLAAGAAENLVDAYVGVDLISNIRIFGAPVPAAFSVTVSGDAVGEVKVTRT